MIKDQLLVEFLGLEPVMIGKAIYAHFKIKEGFGSHDEPISDHKAEKIFYKAIDNIK